MLPTQASSVPSLVMRDVPYEQVACLLHVRRRFSTVSGERRAPLDVEVVGVREPVQEKGGVFGADRSGEQAAQGGGVTVRASAAGAEVDQVIAHRAVVVA